MEEQMKVWVVSEYEGSSCCGSGYELIDIFFKKERAIEHIYKLGNSKADGLTPKLIKTRKPIAECGDYEFTYGRDGSDYKKIYTYNLDEQLVK